MRATTMRALLLALGAVCGVRAMEEEIHNSVTGDFALLGSMCFPAGTADVVEVTIHARSANTEFLMYDDQADSFPLINRESPDGVEMSCEQRREAAKHMQGKATDQVGIMLPPFVKFHTTIKVNEKYKREWFFVVAKCDDTDEPVIIESYHISSPSAISCGLVHAIPSPTAYITAIVFFLICDALLLVAAVIFYRSAQTPYDPSFGSLSYGVPGESSYRPPSARDMEQL